MSGVASVFMRELKLAWSGGGGPALPVGFFAAASSLTPFAVRPDAETLQIAGPGVTWIALALASLLPMERLFQADLEDGTLDAYAGSGVAMEGIAAAKTLAHWIATGIPLAVIAPARLDHAARRRRRFPGWSWRFRARFGRLSSSSARSALRWPQACGGAAS